MTGSPGIVFLDRDGTLIETRVVDGIPIASNDPSAIELLPGVIDGCRELRVSGHPLVMVTNQPDVSRGTARREDVEAINQHLCDLLSLDLVMVCFHDETDNCLCRKPRPGMLVDGAKQLGLSLSASSVIIGDRWRDVEAGRNAGISSVLVARDYGDERRTHPDVSARDFSAAVEWVRTRGPQES